MVHIGNNLVTSLVFIVLLKGTTAIPKKEGGNCVYEPTTMLPNAVCSVVSGFQEGSVIYGPRGYINC